MNDEGIPIEEISFKLKPDALELFLVDDEVDPPAPAPQPDAGHPLPAKDLAVNESPPR